MGCAGADLVLCTDHAEALDAAYLGFLDEKLFTLGGVEGGAYGGHHDALAGRHVGGATHYLGGLAVAEVYGCDVKVVAVGVFDTGEDFACHNAAQTAAYRLDFLYRAGLETDRGEGRRLFFGAEVKVKVSL